MSAVWLMLVRLKSRTTFPIKPVASSDKEDIFSCFALKFKFQLHLTVFMINVYFHILLLYLFFTGRLNLRQSSTVFAGYY